MHPTLLGRQGRTGERLVFAAKRVCPPEWLEGLLCGAVAVVMSSGPAPLQRIHPVSTVE
jgi:hypothetical protein